MLISVPHKGESVLDILDQGLLDRQDILLPGCTIYKKTKGICHYLNYLYYLLPTFSY